MGKKVRRIIRSLDQIIRLERKYAKQEGWEAPPEGRRRTCKGCNGDLTEGEDFYGIFYLVDEEAEQYGRFYCNDCVKLDWFSDDDIPGKVIREIEA